MQAVGIKTALACILFGFSSLGPGGHFQADEGVSLRRDAGGHFAAEFPDVLIIIPVSVLVCSSAANHDICFTKMNLYDYTATVSYR